MVEDFENSENDDEDDPNDTTYTAPQSSWHKREVKVGTSMNCSADCITSTNILSFASRNQISSTVLSGFCSLFILEGNGDPSKVNHSRTYIDKKYNQVLT